MLITFRSREAASVTMRGGYALELLKLMGHSPAVPGALLAPDVPAALARVRENVCDTSELADALAARPRQHEAPPTWRVHCQPQAYPLIDLLTVAADTHCDVLWEEGMSPI